MSGLTTCRIYVASPDARASAPLLVRRVVPTHRAPACAYCPVLAAPACAPALPVAAVLPSQRWVAAWDVVAALEYLLGINLMGFVDFYLAL